MEDDPNIKLLNDVFNNINKKHKPTGLAFNCKTD